MWGERLSEKQIETAILYFLNLHGIFAFKLNNTGVWDPIRKVYRKPNSRYIIRGIPDICAMIKDGPTVWVEVKSSTGKVSEYQNEFIQRCRRMGHIAFVAKSVDDVVKHLDEAYPKWRTLSRD
jgi:hypothetical protein